MKQLFDTWKNFINTLYPHNVGREERASRQSEILHAALGLAGETGEVVDIIKKVWAYDKALDRSKLIEEMGDLLHYYTRLLELYDIRFTEVIEHNHLKLKRRYPNGYTNEEAIAQKDRAPTT